MLTSSEPEGKSQKQKVFNMALAILAGQVGCLTLVIVLAAVFLGLWLDNHFQTRPVLTIVLLLGSVPLSVGMMLLVARAAIKRIKADADKNKPVRQEEKTLGTNS